MKTKFFVLFVVAFLGYTLCLSTAVHAEQRYVFGVHPLAKPSELIKMFKPLIGYLEQELDATLSFRTSKDYTTHVEALASGEIDISYLGPAPYAVLDEQYPGTIRIGAAVLNNGNPTFQGVIIAKEGSSINSLQDLEGKKFAFGDRKSTLSCYMPAFMLMEAGIFKTIEYAFVGSHDNVALGVLNGVFDAGGIKPAVAEKYQARGLKIIAESEPVYEHLIVIGPGIDDATAEKIRTALLGVQDPVVYTSIKHSLTGFTAVEPSDYENLKHVIATVDATIAQ